MRDYERKWKKSWKSKTSRKSPVKIQFSASSGVWTNTFSSSGPRLPNLEQPFLVLLSCYVFSPPLPRNVGQVHRHRCVISGVKSLSRAPKAAAWAQYTYLVISASKFLMFSFLGKLNRIQPVCSLTSGH